MLASPPRRNGPAAASMRPLEGDVVAMTGGVKDAPALNAAAIGIAMGERGTGAPAWFEILKALRPTTTSERRRIAAGAGRTR